MYELRSHCHSSPIRTRTTHTMLDGPIYTTLCETCHIATIPLMFCHPHAHHKIPYMTPLVGGESKVWMCGDDFCCNWWRLDGTLGFLDGPSAKSEGLVGPRLVPSSDANPASVRRSAVVDIPEPPR